MNPDILAILANRQAPSHDRLNAILTLIENPEMALVDCLETYLSDTTEDPDVRSGAALALAKLSGEQSLQILKAFCNDPDKTVRNYVVQAIGMTHEEAAAPLLINALKDTSNTVFATASQGLGELGRAAVPYLIDLLSDAAVDARCVAAWQLGEASATEAVPALVKAIQQEKNVSVLALCIWALGEIGLGTQEVMDILSQAKQEPEPDIRLRAETAMIKIARQSN